MPPRETEWARRQRRNQERAEHVAAHGPGCQLCGNVPKGGKGSGLNQDHDHKTGETRGWLCHRCNRALPTWVNAGWLLAAALYLLPPGENFAYDLRALMREHDAADYLERAQV